MKSAIKLEPINNNDFSLHTKINKNEVVMLLKMHKENVYSSSFPSTVELLKKYLPNVLRSGCSNYRGVKFADEVKDTELGHLFEHIFLENLSKYSCIYFGKRYSYSGVTAWDWLISPKGSFTITVKAKIFDEMCIVSALKDSLGLFRKILRSKDNSDKHVIVQNYLSV